MSGRRRKKKQSGGGDEGAGWMTTYGDLMSLLLSFFILIVSFSSIQESEFQKAIGSLQRALGLLRANPAVVTPTRSPDIYIPPRSKMKEMVDRILHEVKDIPQLENNITFESTDKGVRMRISNPLLFDIGRANIKPQIYPVLNEITSMLDTSDFEIIIEGHTDNVPINNDQFHSNWELSAARAVAVVEYFSQHGITPERLEAAAYGEYHPLKANNTDKGRAKNRRVEIFIPYPPGYKDSEPLKEPYYGRRKTTATF